MGQTVYIIVIITVLFYHFLNYYIFHLNNEGYAQNFIDYGKFLERHLPSKLNEIK